MAQLGAGFDSQYPNMIDTRQVFHNGTIVLPDSDTRLDSEVVNDSLSAIINLQTTLGANVQGAFASLAARLTALEEGGTTLTNVVPFTNQEQVTIPGEAHQQHQQPLFYALYDTSTPRRLLQPGAFSVYAGTLNAVMAFAVPESGILMVAALTPQYVATFTTPPTEPYTVIIPGSTHGLAEPYLFVQAFDAASPMNAIEIGSVNVNLVTFDVSLGFAAPQSGTVMLARGSPRYAQTFLDATMVTIPGAVHGLGTADLLHAVYAPGGNEPFVIHAGGFTVDATTFDITLTFDAPQSGVLVLAPVPGLVAPTVLALLPQTRSVPVPTTATRTVVDNSKLVQLQTSVDTLTSRLSTLETAYQTLLTERQPPTPEEPTA